MGVPPTLQTVLNQWLGKNSAQVTEIRVVTGKIFIRKGLLETQDGSNYQRTFWQLALYEIPARSADSTPLPHTGIVTFRNPS